MNAKQCKLIFKFICIAPMSSLIQTCLNDALMDKIEPNQIPFQQNLESLSKEPIQFIQFILRICQALQQKTNNISQYIIKMIENPKNPSIYTQISTPILNELRKKFNNYSQTPFTFIETSHRSKQYSKLNCETVQLIKNYFNAQNYICLLMPTGTAVPSFYFNLMKQQAQVYSFTSGNSNDSFYKEMKKYNENINKFTDFQQLMRILNRTSSVKQKTIVHFSRICQGRMVKLPEISQEKRSNIILIENLDYCFPWPENNQISSDIAYFRSETGFSMPGYDIVLIKEQLIQKLPNNQDCPDMFCFSLMHKQKSVVNTPFTLCTLVLNENIRYALANSQIINIKIRQNKKKFERKMHEIGCNVNHFKSEADNMIVIDLGDLNEGLKKQIIDKGYGWKLNEDNKFCFYIQLENSTLQKFLQIPQ